MGDVIPLGLRLGCCGPVDAALGEAEAEAISDDFQILAHPIRVQLMAILARASEDVCVCDLEGALPVKQPTVSYHLKLLRQAGLVRGERRGPWVYYALDRERLATLESRLRAHIATWR